MKLQVLPLSQEAFSAYGDVIETQQRDFFHINNGLVERYHDLALGWLRFLSKTVRLSALTARNRRIYR